MVWVGSMSGPPRTVCFDALGFPRGGRARDCGGDVMRCDAMRCAARRACACLCSAYRTYQTSSIRTVFHHHHTSTRLTCMYFFRRAAQHRRRHVFSISSQTPSLAHSSRQVDAEFQIIRHVPSTATTYRNPLARENPSSSLAHFPSLLPCTTSSQVKFKPNLEYPTPNTRPLLAWSRPVSLSSLPFPAPLPFID